MNNITQTSKKFEAVVRYKSNTYPSHKVTVTGYNAKDAIAKIKQHFAPNVIFVSDILELETIK